MEMAMIEAEVANANFAGTGDFAVQGSEGLFAALTSRGLVYNNADFDSVAGATSNSVGYMSNTGLAEFDTILVELENAAFGGGTSYGVFNNQEDMALNLGFSGFRRGAYDFYKTDWKYLNDSVTRGLIGDIEGVIVPAGTSTVYDQSMGKNISRPFLHVRYRKSEADDRKMKSWITGSVGKMFMRSSSKQLRIT